MFIGILFLFFVPIFGYPLIKRGPNNAQGKAELAAFTALSNIDPNFLPNGVVPTDGNAFDVDALYNFANSPNPILNPTYNDVMNLVQTSVQNYVTLNGGENTLITNNPSAIGNIQAVYTNLQSSATIRFNDMLQSNGMLGVPGIEQALINEATNGFPILNAAVTATGVGINNKKQSWTYNLGGQSFPMTNFKAKSLRSHYAIYNDVNQVSTGVQHIIPVTSGINTAQPANFETPEVNADDTNTVDSNTNMEWQALWQIRNILGTSKILPNSDGSTIPLDPNDPTELDGTQIYAGATDYDDAWNSITNDLITTIQSGTIDEVSLYNAANNLMSSIQYRRTLLRQTPNTDKLITANIQQDNLENIYTSYVTQIKTQLGEDIDPESDIDPDFGSNELVDEDNRSPEEIQSTSEMNVLSLVQDILPEGTVFPQGVDAITNGEPTLEDIDPSLLMAGATQYNDVWNTLSVQIGEIQSKSLTASKYSKLRSALAQWSQSIQSRYNSLSTKQKNGDVISLQEIQDYQTHYGNYQTSQQAIQSYDESTLIKDTINPSDNPLIEDPGSILELPPLENFASQGGSDSYKSSMSRTQTTARRNAKKNVPKYGIGTINPYIAGQTTN